MKRILLILVLGSWLLTPTWAQPSAGHYTSLDNKSGDALFNAVSAAANEGYTELGYAGLWDAYEKTDLRPGTRQIWDMYSDCEFTFESKQCGNYSGECSCYNREHSVPQSWWGEGTTKQGCDIFHVVPTDGYINNMRGNWPFGEVSKPDKTSKNGSKLGPNTFSGYSGTAFEPVDEYKGDLVRGILGAMIKWKGDWSQANGAHVFNGTYTLSSNYGLTSFAMNLFLKWHRQDPVSQKELDRNNGIEQTQGNRNPFIDYPDLVEYIWGEKKGQTVRLSSLQSAYDEPGGGDDTQKATMYYPTAYTPLTLDGEWEVGSTATQTISAVGDNITSDVQFSFSGTHASYFSASPTYITADQANAGHNVAIIYKPLVAGKHTASLVVTSANGEFETYSMTVTATAIAAEVTDPDPGTGEEIPAGDYVLVESALDDYSGTYLIVNTEAKKMMNGSLTSKVGDANSLDVTITGKTITATETINASSFTIAPMEGGYSIQGAGGKYISTPASNSVTGTATPVLNTISMDEKGNAVIGGKDSKDDTRTLRYNSTSSVFRYYKSGQQPIQLYKRVTATTPDTDPQPVLTSPIADTTIEIPETTVGTIVSTTFTVQGENLRNTITLAIQEDVNDVFSLSHVTITASEANAGVEVTLTYAPITAGTDEALLSLASDDFEERLLLVEATAVAAETTDPEQGTMSGDYVLVESSLADYSGTYLIVNTEAGKMMDGAITTTGNKIGSNNALDVTIANKTIAATDEVNTHSFTIAPMTGGYSIQGAGGIYISTPSANQVKGSTTAQLNTISIDANGNAVIGGIDTNNAQRTLLYNATSAVFRYYTSTYTAGKSVQLYKKQVATNPDEGDNDGTLTAVENILYGNASLATDVRIYDMMGRLVLQRTNVIAFTCELPSGLYLVRWNNTTTKIRIN